ncbi:hypothetical protein TRAPUB_12706 [Trametes pubescens]|uniref:Uncharacterized protein n=1 Tax=Trametes pubescens TaxID=154538 RepID=A0A1M2VT41_TRAPU|nr:hypothetical protein TRAPUB_12706 [Trametes pubescens]
MFKALCLANTSTLLRPLIPSKHVASLMVPTQSRAKPGNAYPLQSVSVEAVGSTLSPLNKANPLCA